MMYSQSLAVRVYITKISLPLIDSLLYIKDYLEHEHTNCEIQTQSFYVGLARVWAEVSIPRVCIICMQNIGTKYSQSCMITHVLPEDEQKIRLKYVALGY